MPHSPLCSRHPTRVWASAAYSFCLQPFKDIKASLAHGPYRCRLPAEFGIGDHNFLALGIESQGSREGHVQGGCDHQFFTAFSGQGGRPGFQR